MRKLPLKTIGVIVGATALSTLAINASDGIRGVGSMVGLSIDSSGAVCPEGMIPFVSDGRSMCIDQYEASVANGCPHMTPRSPIDTEVNLSEQTCGSVSKEDVRPWGHVTLSQAQRICAASGKRLPTNEEWYRAALGTERTKGCHITDGNASETGSPDCVSDVGAQDMIGNLWEWVDGEVVAGVYENRTLPEEGYVSSVDKDGIALSSQENPHVLYGEDYVWTNSDGVRGMVRGGFFGAGSDAGLHALNASVEPSFSSAGIGFRCVSDA